MVVFLIVYILTRKRLEPQLSEFVPVQVKAIP